MTTVDALPGPVPRPPAWHGWLMSLLLVLAPVLLYSGSYGFPLLELDDHLYYLHFAALHGGAWRGLIDLWSATAMSDYAPISQLTWWLDLAVAGSGSWWFARLHELAWMGLGTLAVHALMLRLGLSQGLAYAVALLYALHPACAQSALWLAERKNLVSLALSLWCVERYIAAVRDGGGWRPGAAAWLFGVLALFAKPHAVALPAMLVAYELTLGSGPWRSRALRLLPPAVVVVAFVAASLLFIRDDLHRAHLGGSLPAAVLLDGGILLRYLAHTVLPTGLTIYYAVSESQPVWLSLALWAVLALIVGCTLVPVATRRLVAFAWLFSLASLAPALNLAPQIAAMTDHYQQWALPGLLMIAGLMVQLGLAHLPDGSRTRLGLVASIGAVVCAAALSLARVPEFASKQRLAAAAVRKQPESAINWSLHAYCLTVASPPNHRDAAGEAALRAFACADSARIFGEERLIGAIEAAVYLHQHGQEGTEAALLDAQCALLTGGAGGDHAAVVRAQIDLRTARPALAIALLAPYFTPVLMQAAVRLRAACRDGVHLPAELPAQVAGGQLITRDLIAADNQEQWNQRLLWSLAAAYLDNHEPELAFDVAAVMVNRSPDDHAARLILAASYRQVGLPGAAARVLDTPP